MTSEKLLRLRILGVAAMAAGLGLSERSSEAAVTGVYSNALPVVPSGGTLSLNVSVGVSVNIPIPSCDSVDGDGDGTGPQGCGIGDSAPCGDTNPCG